MHPYKNGSALLSALFIMTLVAIVATAMSTRLQLDIYKTRMLVTQDKLTLASESVLFWAFSELQHIKKFTSATPDGLIKQYPESLKHLYPDVLTEGALYDLQSKINLNNLTEKKSIALFVNFFSYLYPDLPDDTLLQLVLTLQDWLSNYDLSKGKDEYMSYYTTQKPPYFPSHQRMISRSEFRLLKHVNDALDHKIQRFLIALPESTPININTAPKAVLMALGDGLTEHQADELIEQRGVNGFKKTDVLSPLLQKLNIPNEQITLKSRYFMSRATVQSSDFKKNIYVILKREKNKKGKVTISVIKQSFEVY